MECLICNSSIDKKNVGKYVIGYEETDEFKNIVRPSFEFKKLKNGLFEKVKKNNIVKVRKNIEHKLDKFDLLKKFEDKESPMD